VRLFLASTSLFGFALTMGIYPVLFNLYLLRLGYDTEFVGLINSAGLFTTALFGLPAGALATRWGVRRAMFAGMAVGALFYGLFPLVEFLPQAVHPPMLVLVWVLCEVGMATYFVAQVPFVVGITAPEERAPVFAVQVVVSQVAGFGGSLLGGALPELLAPVMSVAWEDPAPYRVTLLLAAGLSLPAAWLILRTKAEPEAQLRAARAERRGPERAPWALIVIFSLALLLETSTVGVCKTFYNVYLDKELGVSTASIGLLFGVVQLLSAAAAMIMPRLARRWGNARVFAGSSLGVALSMLPLALVPHWLAALAGRVGISAFASISSPAINVYQMEIVEPRWRATMSGTLSTSRRLSWMALAAAGGYVISAAGYKPLFLAAAALTLAGTALFWLYFRTPRGEFAEAGETAEG